MEQYYTIDFETYSEVNLKKVGMQRYSEHETTRALILGYKHCNDASPAVANYFKGMPYYEEHKGIIEPKNPDNTYIEALYKHIREGKTIIAFNTLFEYYIWNNVYCKYDSKIPKLKYNQMLDARVMAVRLGGGGTLDSCSLSLFNEQKETEGKILMHKFCKPLPKKDKNKVDISDLYNYIQYCIKDVYLTEKIVKMFTDRYGKLYYSEEDKIVEQHTMKVNIEMIKIDNKLNNILAYFFVILKKYNDKVIHKLTNGLVEKCTQNKALLDFLIDFCKYEKKSLSKDVIRSLDNYKNELGNKILGLRLGNNCVKLAKCSYIKDKAVGDRLSPELMFHSTLTGRFASKGSNVLNFARPATDKEYSDDTIKKITKYKPSDIIKKLKSADKVQNLGADLVRKIIIPEKGHKLLIADYSQVERRLLCLEAKFKSAQEKHKKGICEYSEFATKYFKEKIVKGDKRRNFGKVAVLQGGYKGGFHAFKGEFEKFGIDITPPEIKKVVDLYRDMNQPIVRYWAIQQDKLMKAVGSNKPLVIKTISGREIIYRDLQIRSTVGVYGAYKYVSYSSGSQFKKLHGGIITSHIIQSIARDLLIYHMAELIKLGYTITLPVHDEVVINIKTKKQEKEIMKVLKKLPKWLDYAHSVDYSVQERYCK